MGDDQSRDGITTTPAIQPAVDIYTYGSRRIGHRGNDVVGEPRTSRRRVWTCPARHDACHYILGDHSCRRDIHRCLDATYEYRCGHVVATSSPK